MRFRSFLRPARGKRSITDVCVLTGIARGEISMFERGHAIPNGRQAALLAPVYGPIDTWYPAGVLAILLPDLAICAGCGRELPADSSRRRRYHGAACGTRARRRLMASSGASTTKGAAAPSGRSLEERRNHA